jgi:Flp pilus assembly protein TadB
MADRNSPSGSQSNAATAIALLGLLLISALLLGLMALVLPQVLGVLVVILIFAVPAAIHYLVWGWWLSQSREREREAEGEKVEDRG